MYNTIRQFLLYILLLFTISASLYSVQADFTGEGQRFSVVVETPELQVESQKPQAEVDTPPAEPAQVVSEREQLPTPPKKPVLQPKAKIIQNVTEKPVEELSSVEKDGEDDPCYIPEEVRPAPPEPLQPSTSGATVEELDRMMKQHESHYMQTFERMLRGEMKSMVSDILPTIYLLFATILSLLITVIFLLLRGKR